MTLLTPLALLWIGSIPALLWLWRLSATSRQTRVPSLVPFEHLLKRESRQRTQLVVNALFWLQLLALLGATLALAQPVLWRRHAATTLVVLDTSASMGARLRGSSAFERAQRVVLARVSRKASNEQFFIMATSPVSPVTAQPTSDGLALTRTLQELRVNHLGGNLSTTLRMGRALLGTEPDRTLIVTDEARPSDSLGNRVEWIGVGEPMPNVAIVGLDAQGALCHPTDARVMVTLQNFSTQRTSVTVAATQHGHRLAELREVLDPNTRRSLALPLPPNTEGLIDIALSAQPDGLEVDNHAWIDIRHTATLPIVVRASSPSLQRTLATWLSACDALTWNAEVPTDGRAYLLITDRAQNLPSVASAIMLFHPPANPQPILSPWVASADHPIGAYFTPVEVVSAALNLSVDEGLTHPAVISGLINGRKVPIVEADEREGRRIVSLRLDPTGSSESTPVLLAFFNSLRWLMGQAQSATTGEPFVVHGLTPGAVTIHRPDGTTEIVKADRGVLRYETTTVAGVYRCAQGPISGDVAVNFFDPLESNVMERVSTWRTIQEPSMKTTTPHRVPQPLTNPLLVIILVLLLTEWILYALRTTQTAANLGARIRGVLSLQAIVRHASMKTAKIPRIK